MKVLQGNIYFGAEGLLSLNFRGRPIGSQARRYPAAVEELI
jgi:hypothetical protein